MGVQIKEKITGKTASGFLLFWQNTGPKKPVNEPSPLKCVTVVIPICLQEISSQRLRPTNYKTGYCAG